MYQQASPYCSENIEATNTSAFFTSYHVKRSVAFLCSDTSNVLHNFMSRYDIHFFVDLLHILLAYKKIICIMRFFAALTVRLLRLQ